MGPTPPQGPQKEPVLPNLGLRRMASGMGSPQTCDAEAPTLVALRRTLPGCSAPRVALRRGHDWTCCFEMLLLGAV